MSAQYDAIIVGAGLFGQVIAKALQADGHKVLMIDARKPDAGSGPAACLMKPSWFSSMGKEVYNPALTLLDELYGVKDIDFKLVPSGAHTTVHWCNPHEILSGTYMTGEVQSISAPHVFTNHGTFQGRTIIVAAGIWTEKLLPQYKQIGQKGVAFLWNNNIEEPFIKVWAPYRQLVAFNRGDGLWVGDGTAIKAENWTAERLVSSLNRCQEAAGLYIGKGDDGPRTMTGIRPYAKGHKPCLLAEVHPGLWVASGGAKNGTLAAGYCAYTIRSALA